MLLEKSIAAAYHINGTLRNWLFYLLILSKTIYVLAKHRENFKSWRNRMRGCSRVGGAVAGCGGSQALGVANSKDYCLLFGVELRTREQKVLIGKIDWKMIFLGEELKFELLYMNV
jgi:hypothetical protein